MPSGVRTWFWGVVFLAVACSPVTPAKVGVEITPAPTEESPPDLDSTPVNIQLESGVQGTVLIGPTCPVQKPGDECKDRPFQAVIDIMNENDQLVASVQTDAQGYFELALEPGTYRLHPETPGESKETTNPTGIAVPQVERYPRADDQWITVVPGEFLPVMIVFDSGIR